VIILYNEFKHNILDLVGKQTMHLVKGERLKKKRGPKGANAVK
jgi:hypothetical protein